MFKIMIGVLFFTIVTLVVFLNLDPNIVQNSITETSSLANDFMTVTLSGEIQKPGTYIIQKDKTLGDVIQLAGGTTTNADEHAFHLTTSLIANFQYYIAPAFDPNDVCGTTPLIKVGINSASESNLMTLSNIGTSLARAMIEYRESQGPFQYIEQIMEVPGIGQSTFTRVKNYIQLL